MRDSIIKENKYHNKARLLAGLDNMLNEKCKDQDALACIKYISDEEKLEKLLDNQQVLITPIVRNGKQAAVGYAPEVWKGWN